MSVWRKGISWSKFKLALSCPLALQKSIDKESSIEWRPTYHAQLGTTVQKVFEVYFNQGVNLKPGGDQESVITKCADIVLASKWFDGLAISYTPTTNSDTMRVTVHEHVLGGLRQFRELGMLARPIRSEVDWGATFRNLRLFGRMDFVVHEGDGVYLYDGKSHQKENADERQLLFYALVASASSKTVLGGGFLYWGLKYHPVDLSAAKIKEFVDDCFSGVSPIFERLKTGIDVLEAKPEKGRCYWCAWGRTCKFSLVAREPVDFDAPVLAGFGEAR